MATTQLGPVTYEVGGQTSISGWTVLSSVKGFAEDSENKNQASGRFGAKITYSRRQTLQLTMEANHGTTTTTYDTGGSITIGGVDYKIRSASRTNTRGPVQVTLDLISLADDLA